MAYDEGERLTFVQIWGGHCAHRTKAGISPAPPKLVAAVPFEKLRAFELRRTWDFFRLPIERDELFPILLRQAGHL